MIVTNGDVVKATASYRYVGGCQKVAFFNKKSTSTMVKWHFQGPCFFLISALAKIWLKFQHFWNLDFHHIPKGLNQSNFGVCYFQCLGSSGQPWCTVDKHNRIVHFDVGANTNLHELHCCKVGCLHNEYLPVPSKHCQMIPLQGVIFPILYTPEN